MTLIAYYKTRKWNVVLLYTACRGRIYLREEQIFEMDMHLLYYTDSGEVGSAICQKRRVRHHSRCIVG